MILKGQHQLRRAQHIAMRPKVGKFKGLHFYRKLKLTILGCCCTQYRCTGLQHKFRCGKLSLKAIVLLGYVTNLRQEKKLWTCQIDSMLAFLSLLPFAFFATLGLDAQYRAGIILPSYIAECGVPRIY